VGGIEVARREGTGRTRYRGGRGWRRGEEELTGVRSRGSGGRWVREGRRLRERERGEFVTKSAFGGSD
jgi:hypothetical protein